MQKRKINGTEIAFVDRGSGPVLLLAHGFPLDHSMWDAQIDIFAEQYRVIAVDLRGFGRSQVDANPSEGTIGLDLLADDLAAMLDSLQIDEPIVFVGLSMGGFCALHFPAVVEGLRRLQPRRHGDDREQADGPPADG